MAGPIASWIHRPSPSAIKKIRYHQEPSARKDQMDIFNVDAHVWGGNRGRERERGSQPQGFMCVRPLTPHAWCLQSVSCCHREPVKSYSCTGASVSEL